MTTGSFHVLVSSSELPTTEKTAQVIARFTGGVAIDARQKAKTAWGFLGENLSEDEARRLAAVSAEMGVAARVVPGASVVHPPAPVPVHWLRAAPEGLFYIPGTTEKAERPVPWESVRLLSAAPLKETTTFTKTVKEGPTPGERAVGLGIMMVTGLPVGMGKSKEVKKTTSQTELFMYLDVFAQAPEGPLRLHVDGQKFNYGALGDAKGHDIFGNLRLLMQGVHGGLPPATLRNHGVRGMLAGKPLSSLGYETQNDYEKEIRWLLTISK